MKKIILKTVLLVLTGFILTCGLLYFAQEKALFFPEKLHKKYKFCFDQNFEEINIRTSDNRVLNGILFKASNSKGLIFYLHGNAGSLKSWGKIASAYTNLNYDLFIIDYSGFGKSEGKIHDEKLLFNDIQLVYSKMKLNYPEKDIIILGYSIGTGLAAELAASNHPKLLILQAPYFNLKDLVKHKYPLIPTFLLKYKFETNNSLIQCKMPVVIFHGNKDQVIYYNSSLKLKSLFKTGDTLLTLNGQGHNGMSSNTEYLTELARILK